jgi:hypothetical protein
MTTFLNKPQAISQIPVSAVDINGVAERLEGVEADADREDDLKGRKVGFDPEPGEPFQRVLHEESVVLEEAEEAEVRDQTG